MYLSDNTSFCLSIYLSDNPSLCLSCVCVSIYRISIYLTICLSDDLSISLSGYLSACLSVYLPINQSICLSGYLTSVYRPVYVSIHHLSI